MKDKLSKKNKSLKLAIERYNLYKEFVDTYNKTKSLDNYVQHIMATRSSMSEGVAQHYESIIHSYKHGNVTPLLTNLYDRLLAADEYRNKVANELKSLLREI